MFFFASNNNLSKAKVKLAEFNIEFLGYVVAYIKKKFPGRKKKNVRFIYQFFLWASTQLWLN